MRMDSIFTGRKTAVNTLDTVYDYMAVALDGVRNRDRNRREISSLKHLSPLC